MPRYFIHILDGVLIRDEEGEPLPNLTAARTAALRTFGETLRSREDRFWEDGSLRVYVEDEGGETVVDIEARDLLAAV
ncbi:MAG: hypothetical protein REJ23_07825 [Brevundimonas sp.]|nr:hypothetical protein [Brevundimonas sp.]